MVVLEKRALRDGLGLTDAETTVLQLLLERGSSTGGELIDASGKYRAAVYDVLKRLMQKGLVGFVREGRTRRFSLAPLSLVRQSLDEQVDVIRQRQSFLTHVERAVASSRSSSALDVMVLRGRKGLLTVLNDVLDQGKEMHVFGASGQLRRQFRTDYQQFNRRRARRGLAIRIIYNSTVRPERRESELERLSARYFDARFDTPATTYVYADRVAIIQWADQPVIIWTQNKPIAQSYEKQFQMLWRNAKP